MFNRKLPLRYQVEQSVRSEILTRQFGKTGPLRTEEQLAKRYGVSLITVREALRSVEQGGMITRHRRFGTFVRSEVYHHQELHVLGSIKTVVSQQANEDTEVLARKKIAVPAEFKSIFHEGRTRPKLRKHRILKRNVRLSALLCRESIESNTAQRPLKEFNVDQNHCHPTCVGCFAVRAENAGQRTRAFGFCPRDSSLRSSRRRF